MRPNAGIETVKMSLIATVVAGALLVGPAARAGLGSEGVVEAPLRAGLVLNVSGVDGLALAARADARSELVGHLGCIVVDNVVIRLDSARLIAIADPATPLGRYSRRHLIETHLLSHVVGRVVSVGSSRDVLEAVRSGAVDLGVGHALADVPDVLVPRTLGLGQRRAVDRDLLVVFAVHDDLAQALALVRHVAAVVAHAREGRVRVQPALGPLGAHAARGSRRRMSPKRR